MMADAAMAITLATNNGDVGGGEVMLLRIAEALRKLSVSVSVVAPAEPAGLADAAADSGFATIRLPARGRKQWMWQLRRWDRRERSGVLWCNGLVPAVATAGHRGRIVHIHQRPLGLQRPLTVIARRGAIATLVPSRYMQTVVPRSTVLLNWTGPIDPAVRVRGPGEPYVVGFLGRLSPDKGMLVLAEAMRRLQRERPGKFRLLVAGEPRFVRRRDWNAVDRALAGIADLTDRAGWMDRDALFTQIDLLVVPSVWGEPFGLSAAEAMASGVPVIVSDAGALPEVVGETGVVVPAGDAEALAAAIVGQVTPDSGRTDALLQRWERLFSPQAGERRVGDFIQYFAQRGRFG